MTKLPLIFCALAGSAFVARAASAGVCVELDASRDTLSEGDRNAARLLLAQVIQQQGLQVVPRNCAGTFVVYHVKLGNSVTVFMQAPQGYRQATARTLEEVPPVYSQMVRSLLTGQPMNTINDTVDRTNVTSAQQAPNRVEADSLWYARLGYGGAIGPIFSHGPAFGFGYRYELDSLGIDFSFLNFMIDSGSSNNGSSVGATGSWIKLMALYFLNPQANRSSYLGGGLGWGGTAVARSSTDTMNGTINGGSSYTGSGLQAELSAGYELLRASTIRIFIQADATLPFYKVTSTGYNTTTFVNTTLDTTYVPSFAISFGIGWGRSITRVHVVE
jgi:hypothetical protein